MKLIRNKIKNQDLFGQQLNIHLDGETEHQTFCGGVLSLVVGSLMLVVLFLTTKRLVTHSDDQITEHVDIVDVEQIESIALSDMNYMIGLSLSNATTFYSLKYDKKMMQYINITMFEDSYSTETGQLLKKEKPVKTKECDINDVNPELRSKLQMWNKFGWTYLCPEDSKNINLYGKLGTSVTKAKGLGIRIQKCNPQNQEKINCSSTSEIDEYIKTVKIDMAEFKQSINFQERNKKPVFNIMDTF